MLLLQCFFNFRKDPGNALESIVSILSAKLANIVAAAASKWRLPVVNATTVCVDVKDKQLPKAKDDKVKPDEVKPEKNGPPKVNVNLER